MCSINAVDEWVELWSKTQRKARKEYVCFECRDSIQIGDVYVFHKYRSYGKFDSHRSCLICNSWAKVVTVVYGGYMFGSLEEDLQNINDDYGAFELSSGDPNWSLLSPEKLPDDSERDTSDA